MCKVSGAVGENMTCKICTSNSKMKPLAGNGFAGGVNNSGAIDIFNISMVFWIG